MKTNKPIRFFVIGTDKDGDFFYTPNSYNLEEAKTLAGMMNEALPGYNYEVCYLKEWEDENL